MNFFLYTVVRRALLAVLRAIKSGSTKRLLVKNTLAVNNNAVSIKKMHFLLKGDGYDYPHGWIFIGESV